MKKDIIYIDIDDEITAIIDKVRSSPNKIVALVLPKRATMLQSIVNMRLLKRTADGAKKKIVLITAETGILPLAGVVGLHVARTLQTKPEVPPTPDEDDSSVLAINDSTAEDAPVDKSRSIGELAGIGADGTARSASPRHIADSDTDTIELDNVPAAPAPEASKDKKSKDKGEKKDKKLTVPNFDKFRLRFAIIVGIFLLLIISWYFGYVVMPKASVSIQAEITGIPVERTITISPAAEEFSLEDSIVPAEAKQVKKSETEKFAPTEEKDTGDKATGTVTLYNCNKEDKLADRNVSIPAGTGVSASNMTFIMNSDAVIEPSSFVGNECQQNKPTEVSVTAQNPGDKYNLSARTYAVAGYSSIIADGAAMSGGTTKMVKVVSQADFDAAKAKLLERNTDELKKSVKEDLEEAGLMALDDTFEAKPGEVTSVPKIGEPGSEATASVEYTVTMVGVKTDDIKQLVEDSIQDKFDKDKQKVYKDGLDEIEFEPGQKMGNGNQSMKMKTTVSAGPQLDEEAIKKEVAGKKRGDAESAIESRPGISDSNVRLSPFWVLSAPKNLNKITVTFDVPENN